MLKEVTKIEWLCDGCKDVLDTFDGDEDVTDQARGPFLCPLCDPDEPRVISDADQIDLFALVDARAEETDPAEVANIDRAIVEIVVGKPLTAARMELGEPTKKEKLYRVPPLTFSPKESRVFGDGEFWQAGSPIGPFHVARYGVDGTWAFDVPTEGGGYAADYQGVGYPSKAEAVLAATEWYEAKVTRGLEEA